MRFRLACGHGREAMATLTLMCGLPGSGKSHHAARMLAAHPTLRVVTADAIRVEALNPARRAGVFIALYQRARAYLAAGSDVVVDVCALHRSDRDSVRHMAREYGARAELVVVCTRTSVCRERDHTRAHPIGYDDAAWQRARELIARAARLAPTEGWDRVTYVPGPKPELGFAFK